MSQPLSSTPRIWCAFSGAPGGVRPARPAKGTLVQRYHAAPGRFARPSTGPRAVLRLSTLARIATLGACSVPPRRAAVVCRLSPAWAPRSASSSTCFSSSRRCRAGGWVAASTVLPESSSRVIARRSPTSWPTIGQLRAPTPPRFRRPACRPSSRRNPAAARARPTLTPASSSTPPLRELPGVRPSPSVTASFRNRLAADPAGPGGRGGSSSGVHGRSSGSGRSGSFPPREWKGAWQG